MLGVESQDLNTFRVYSICCWLEEISNEFSH
jgi:hypothetical protein